MNNLRRFAGFGLVEILVVAALLIALSAFLIPKMIGPAKIVNGHRVSTPMSKAHDTVCISNIRSVRQSIAVAKTGETEDKNPASLKDLKLPVEFLSCPDGKEPYNYNSQTGEVHCVHFGHENF